MIEYPILQSDGDLVIRHEPYWFGEKQIPVIEKMKDAKYVGAWCTKNPNGGWNESPVDVFYVENPDTEKGHKNYFGLFYRDKALLICDATSAFDNTLEGRITNSGEVVVSRYRHDFVHRDGVMVDGGRDYFKRDIGDVAKIRMVDGHFVLESRT